MDSFVNNKFNDSPEVQYLVKLMYHFQIVQEIVPHPKRVDVVVMPIEFHCC